MYLHTALTTITLQRIHWKPVKCAKKISPLNPKCAQIFLLARREQQSAPGEKQKPRHGALLRKHLRQTPVCRKIFQDFCRMYNQKLSEIAETIFVFFSFQCLSLWETLSALLLLQGKLRVSVNKRRKLYYVTRRAKASHSFFCSLAAMGCCIPPKFHH